MPGDSYGGDPNKIAGQLCPGTHPPYKSLKFPERYLRPRCQTRPIMITTANNQEKAMELRLAGKTFRAIAKELGVSPRAAYRYVVRSRERAEARATDLVDEARQEARVESERVDALIERHWSAAIDPSHPYHIVSTALIVKLMDLRAKLLGTYAPTRVNQAILNIPMTPQQARRELARMGLLSPETLNQHKALPASTNDAGDEVADDKGTEVLDGVSASNDDQ